MSSKNIPRLFIDKELKLNAKIELNHNDKHYLKNVLRLNNGDFVKIFNGLDGEWKASFKKEKNYLHCIKKIKSQKKELGPTLYFALIKNHNTRWMIEKVTELGIEKLVPIITERTNNKNFNEEKAFLHVKEASEVSDRLTLPRIEKKNTLLKILEQSQKNSDILFFCNESMEDDILQNQLKSLKNKKVAFLIGPEGGFSPSEVLLIKSFNHVKPVKLFNRILKAETAAILAISILQSYQNI